MTDNEALTLAVKMHEEFNALETKFDLEFVLNKDMWFRNGDREIGTNTEGNKKDLFEYDGETYSYEIRYIQYEDDDYVLAKVDNGCGDKYFMMFLKKDEVFEDEDQ